MGLRELLKRAMAEQSCLPKTFDSYWFWLLKLHAFISKPASQWRGEDVQRWMWSLHKANYSASARKQALCASAFVFKYVIKADMGRLNLPPMPRVRQTLRTIPTREELGRIFTGLSGQSRLMAGLMYGAGLRVGECCKLRVKDIDFANTTIRVYNGKGDKSRLTLLPIVMVPSLHRHLAWRKAMHDNDLAAGCGLVELPGRLAQKYRAANRELGWQWLFPSTILRGQYRWHATDESVAKQMRVAVREAGIVKRITPHTLRHSFATHAMRSGNDIETVRDLLGHDSIETTAIYLHAGAARGISPLDCALPSPSRLLPT